MFLDFCYYNFSTFGPRPKKLAKSSMASFRHTVESTSKHTQSAVLQIFTILSLLNTLIFVSVNVFDIFSIFRNFPRIFISE